MRFNSSGCPRNADEAELWIRSWIGPPSVEEPSGFLNEGPASAHGHLGVRGASLNSVVFSLSFFVALGLAANAITAEVIGWPSSPAPRPGDENNQQLILIEGALI